MSSDPHGRMVGVEDEELPRKRGGGCATALLTLLTLALCGWAALSLASLDRDRYTVAVAALTQYAVVAGAVLLLIALLLRRWLNVLVVALVVAALSYYVVPRALPDEVPPAAGAPLKVMSFNAYLGRADAERIAAEVRRNRIDVLSVQELTPQLVSRLEAAGLFAELPHRVLHPGPAGEGTGIVSRYPLRELGEMPETVLAQPSALVDLPGRDVELTAVHAFWPMGESGTGTWEQDLRALPGPSRTDRARVLAGDFNATLDLTRMREFIGRGYTDAAAATGQGLLPTWPSGWFPPPVTIDHVLTSGNIRPEHYRVLDVPGSDHRAVLVTLRVMP
ncbi:endonuclease/exonuclease/phosphatase family protein [Saccharopolyspora griseoalba]|uniref:Endonuclease/exonuclease/phosphatase family protein n=1 Tax=Saccharopolyspora griseoalba TaxID=1431848 RepID=A0ABW2LHZ3_9PSEU